MSVEIVEAVAPEQIEQFRTLLTQYASEREGGFSERMTQDLRDLPGRYAAPNGNLFLALVENVPVGCAAWTKVTDAMVEMKRLYVQPDQRGNGLARLLLLRVIREARERGYAQVAISTWGSATPAISLYESIDFKPIPPFKQSPSPIWFTWDLT
jgi:putative acetyltransferase